jgi:tRNA threonylcarbamoyladenosine biosynthesis protein TsaB
LRLLAFDTIGDGGSAGVFADRRALAVRRAEAGPGQAERLPCMLQAVLADAGLTLAEMDGLAVARGPGSFTGIRTGLAAARGLALVTRLPVFAPTTFEVLVRRLLADGTDGRRVGAVLDARRGQVYWQLFTGQGAPAAEPRAVPPEVVAADLLQAPGAPVRLVGSGVGMVLPLLGDLEVEVVDLALDAVAVAVAAEAMAARGEGQSDAASLTPLYLRGADARPNAGRALLAVGG